jgi:hypothetical protein
LRSRTGASCAKQVLLRSCQNRIVRALENMMTNVGGGN